MAAKSKIKRMPVEIRQFIEKLLREDRLTLNEMMQQIQDKFPGQEVPSRSGLNRYQNVMEKMTSRMRDIETASNALIGELGESVGEKSGALLAHAITTLATNAALNAQDNDDISIEEIRKLARAAKDAMHARRISLAERQELQKEARDRLLREQSAALSSVVKAGGLSNDSAEIIRAQILGVKSQA